MVPILKFFIGAWLTISPLTGQSDITSTISLEFSESMSIDGLLNILNYSANSDSVSFKIYKIGIVYKLGVEIISDTSVIALITERLPYRKEFIVTAKNIKDKSGNLIADKNTAWFFYNGYSSDRIIKPSVRLE